MIPERACHSATMGTLSKGTFASAKTLTALSAIRSILFIIKKITSSNQISGWNNENVNQIRYYTSDHPNVIVVINGLLKFAHSTTHINSYTSHNAVFTHHTHVQQF
jgi:hypothetical protein